MPLPTLVIVSGPPGSGKTQLAHALASAIGCPAVIRDEIKEGMAHAEGRAFTASDGDALTRRTCPLFFDVLRLLLTNGVTVVAEAAFQDKTGRSGLGPLLSLADLRIVQCEVDEAVARDRVQRRLADPRRAAHADPQWLEQGPRHFDRISLDAPSIAVDTTNGYEPDLAEVVRFIYFPARVPQDPQRR